MEVVGDEDGDCDIEGAVVAPGGRRPPKTSRLVPILIIDSSSIELCISLVASAPAGFVVGIRLVPITKRNPIAAMKITTQ